MKENSRSIKWVLGFGCALLLCASIAESRASLSTSLLPDVSLLSSYATFGNFYNDHNVNIIGNAGVSDYGTLTFMGASDPIAGNLYLGTGVSVTGTPKVTSGHTIYYNQNLLAAQAQVKTASDILAGFTAATGDTYGTINSATALGSENGVADVQVFKITGSINASINLTGDAGDYFVLNVADMALGGGDIIGSSALASHTFVNVTGTANLGLLAHVTDYINAMTLIPYASYVEMHNVSGSIWSGYGEVKLMSDATVNYVPYEPPPTVPEPSTIIAGALLLLPFGATLFRGRSASH